MREEDGYDGSVKWEQALTRASLDPSCPRLRRVSRRPRLKSRLPPFRSLPPLRGEVRWGVEGREHSGHPLTRGA